MRLTPTQLDEYRERGFVELPNLISDEELAVLRRDLTALVGTEREGIIKEKNGAVRTAFRVHDLDGPTGLGSYDALARVPRALEPARQLLDERDLYVYHTKCNLKEAVDGEIWQWHQDFGYWQKDGVPSADGMTTALLMLSEATEMGGCLYFIPGSHKEGRIEPALDETTTSYKLWTVPKPDVIALTRKYGDPVAITGKPGKVVLFHPYLVHGSGHNMSPYSRWHIYTVYNQVRNKPVGAANPRPQWVVSRNYTPLAAADDTAIVRSERPALS
jgi:ectoine hydroxylase